MYGTNFGGYGAPYYADTWIYSFTENNWIKKESTVSPSYRSDAKLEFSPVLKKPVLFGGSSKVADDKLWIYSEKALLHG
ncbi:MAG: hypothetical protein D6732_03970 [Methanobacteriota archaeon]|nr:MAG: hypothetical protein D6732_03970 [Euryarchaeota archaeon]